MKPLADLDETFYIDSFWNAICDVCIFFLNPTQLPPPEFRPLPSNLSPLDLEHSTIVRFG